jgi:hypothetical protein
VKFIICCPIILLATMLVLHAQQLGLSYDCATNPPDFEQLSYQAANDAVNSESDLITVKKTKVICPEYIANLVKQLRRGHLSNDNKSIAIYFLGSFRPNDTDSIEILIENIDFRASRLDPKTDLTRWGKYPAEEALIKIGKPVVAPILDYLPNETNKLRRHLMCEVLRKVEGKEAAQNQIKQKITGEQDVARQTSLELVLKELEK